MKKSLIVGLLIVVGLVVVIGGYLIGLYNRLVTLDQGVAAKQAQVEVVLQRRFDLIPNLVNSTKAVLTQEQKVFSDIANARANYAGAKSGTQDKLNAAKDLESSLSRLLVIVESYPTLKSDQTVKDLMTELAGSENRIAVERQRFNESVAAFNVVVKKFPTNLVAGILGFSPKQLFEAVNGADTAPAVNLQ